MIFIITFLELRPLHRPEFEGGNNKETTGSLPRVSEVILLEVSML